MADQRQSDVLGALPRHRPQRRSAKRPARANGTSTQPGNDATTRSSAGSARAPEATAETGARTRQPAATKSRGSGQKTATKGRGPGQASAVRRIPDQPRPAGNPKAGARRASKTDRLRQPPQPRGIPSQPRAPVPPFQSHAPAPSSPERPELLGTAVKAAAELTEIGLSLGAHVLRRAVSRLPRP